MDDGHDALENAAPWFCLEVRFIMYPYMKKTLNLMDDLENKLKKLLGFLFEKNTKKSFLDPTLVALKPLGCFAWILVAGCSKRWRKVMDPWTRRLGKPQTYSDLEKTTIFQERSQWPGGSFTVSKHVCFLVTVTFFWNSAVFQRWTFTHWLKQIKLFSIPFPYFCGGCSPSDTYLSDMLETTN